MKNADGNHIPPRPWRVLVALGECEGIVDANGFVVVETNSGFYPPNRATCEFIVEAINALSTPKSAEVEK